MNEPADTPSLLAQAFAQAPGYIQDFVRSGKYDGFLEKVRTTENLHIDVLDTVSDEVLMMLLGMSEPQELTDNLKKEAGLTDAQADSVIAIANREIFAPLQEELRESQSSAGEASAPETPVIPVSPVPAALSPAPAPAAPPPVLAPVPSPLAEQTPAPVPAPVPAEPMVRTMAHDVEAMKTGTAAAPAPYQMPAAPVLAAPALEAPQQPSLPSRWAAPVTAPSDTPSFSKVPGSSPASRNAAPDIQEVTSTLQKYGIDPYREPTE